MILVFCRVFFGLVEALRRSQQTFLLGSPTILRVFGGGRAVFFRLRSRFVFKICLLADH